ncbi:MAG: hypothetical protein K2M07_06575 [Muribaculaceae bacterium]|nr:hypothetical protein [Muribaculaceae bacterium]
MRKTLFLLLTLILPTIIHAAQVRVDVGPLRYTVDTDSRTAEVFGPAVNTTINNLVIPDYIEYEGNKIPVTSIMVFAFYDWYKEGGQLTVFFDHRK